MFLVIDNYDSFTYNLVHYIGELGAELVVIRNDVETPDTLLARKPEGIILSPGPCTPNDAGVCLDLLAAADGRVPILGVCLGHQSIGQHYGANVVRANQLMHGKLSTINHEGRSVFKDVPNGFLATRYHSLTIDPPSVGDNLIVTAKTDDGVIMGIQHRDHPVHGVQFHPESIASEHGHLMISNFLNFSRDFNKELNRAVA